MKLFNKCGVCLLLLLIPAVLIQGSIVRAAAMTPDEAIRWGFDHSPTFQNMFNSMDQTHLVMDQLKANLGWNLSLAGDALHGNFDPALGQNPVPQGTDETVEQWGISLQGSKNFLWGLNLQSKISVRDDFSFEELDDKVNVTLSASQQVFPRIVLKPEEDLYAAQHNLEKSRLSLDWQKGWKQIEWVEACLNIARLQGSVLLAEENLELAHLALTEAQAAEKIGEAGEQRLLSAQLTVKQAETRLLQAKQQYSQKKQAWYQDLNLPAGQEVDFTALTPEWQKKVIPGPAAVPDLTDFQGLMEQVLQTHYQSRSMEIDQRFAEQQLGWHQRSGLPQISVNGNYDYLKDNWSVGINASYNLFDGGLQKLSQRSDAMQLQQLREEYTNLTRSLRLQLETYISQYELAKLQLEEKSLAYEKARLEEQLAKRQWEARVITNTEYRQKELLCKQAGLDRSMAEDAQLIAQWRLVYFCGMANSF